MGVFPGPALAAWGMSARAGCRRLLFISLCCGVLSPAVARELSEAEAIAAMLARDDFVALEQARRGAAQAELEQAALRTNPTLSIGREGVTSGGAREAETRLEATQQLDLAGRRRFAREAASHRLAATDSELAGARTDAVADLRRVFARVLFGVRVVDALDAALVSLAHSAQVVERLAESGEASGYDRHRVKRELSALRVKRDTAAAELARDRALLAAFVDDGASQQLVPLGASLPAPPPALDEMRAQLRERAQLLALMGHAKAADSEVQVSRRGWVPDVTVGLGTKVVETGHGDRGDLTLSLGIPVPLFDRGQARTKRAVAEREAYRAEHALQFTRLSGELDGAWQQATRLFSAALDYRRDVLISAHELGRIAQTAYAAGEGGVLELIDASRTELETELTSFELDHQARMARIELDQIAGVDSHE
ncbi:MAG: TolC family protein [Proteobacteria bacterium]|nr:TolC family protein [Pseudomonadota bacterium]